MSNHAWCRDIPRDEAVRASEDGRSGPLPTLEEAISGVTNRRPVDAGGGGNVTGGMRTERVTLEITHKGIEGPAASWDWDDKLGLPWEGESVRVVDEPARTYFPTFTVQDVAKIQNDCNAGVRSWQDAHTKALGERNEARDERDAAIRERDTLRAERITQGLTADRFAAAVAEADTMRNRVAELEEQLESVADRAATAENRVAELEQLSRQRAAATLARVDELEHRGRESYSRGWNAAITREREAEKASKQQQATAEMALESAPAANGAAGTCWLTGDERLAVSGAILILDQQGPTNIGRSLNALLDRSSPPEVVLEDFTPDAIRNLDTKYLAGWDQCMALAKRSILAAGVTVKEVRRE